MKEIRIGYKNYKIVYQDEIYLDGDSCYGTIEYGSGVISIANDLDDEHTKVVLIHEVLHGIDEMYNIELKESQVEMLAKALYITLKDNKLIKE